VDEHVDPVIDQLTSPDQVSPGLRQELIDCSGLDRSGSVIVVVEATGDDGDHVGLDVVHEPVLLSYPA
jgi:hypothetical protein